MTIFGSLRFITQPQPHQIDLIGDLITETGIMTDDENFYAAMEMGEELQIEAISTNMPTMLEQVIRSQPLSYIWMWNEKDGFMQVRDHEGNRDFTIKLHSGQPVLYISEAADEDQVDQFIEQLEWVKIATNENN